jgi:tetratricopeptide (TPR) repeat protein
MTEEKKNHDMALEHAKQGNFSLAIEKYNILIERSNNSEKRIDYLREMGEIYEKINKTSEAITECYIKIIKIQPNNGFILHNIGCCYFRSGQFKLAIHYFNKVLKLVEIADVYSNLGNCFANIKDYVSAEKAFLRGCDLNNNNNGINSSLGSLYYYIKQYDKSIQYYYKINDIHADNATLYNLCFPYLAKKNFEKGFELYETRLKMKTTQTNQNMHDRVDIPFLNYWNGSDKCERLLIVAEQGLGDMIQFYRFILQLADLHPEIKITFFCKLELAHLFNSYNKFEVVTEFNYAGLSVYEYKAYLMSLPGLLKVNQIMPNSVEYIKTHPEKILNWRNKLTSISKTFSNSIIRPKVGFVYNGLLSSFIEKHIPLKEFKILCDLDVDLICIHRKKEIQKDIDDYEKCATPEEKSNNGRIHFFDIDSDGSAPFDDTVHILKNLDLLITVDTITVHLAGVLNVKTWLLLGHSEWRWSDDPTSTYWYNSVELIRTTGEEFKDIIKTKVKDKLTHFTNSHSHII